MVINAIQAKKRPKGKKDKCPEMKEHYLMDNAPIHSSTDIGKYIHSRGYQYVYLPPYSPELIQSSNSGQLLR
ncbi:hypothetical protein G6F61_006495 [Rhizopus arrhizus]|nr:hypothetical protein G6F61_006495 [Rhizopus arrhizus]